ncbi:hypothetical protein GCM10010387_59870 [Streptomyces inusitatus]|uniref:TniQ domain-containing protein n=1 Tax=Streptomyces inusitatus TaxID=68221 RepID=A0A918QLU3_9ACTN|nr:TniQ family protein [Streptomyces inusitatus]GGZ58027.1 hypothetical protein GCM10010387_59870 [Streptomyces inusitatus]
MVTEPRQLPRGLAPLADESLPGYVLRLAHRLGTAPGDIATRTGLSQRPAGLLPLGFLHAVGADTAQVFAQVTRLTPDEVSGLGLASLSPRYGPLDLTHTSAKVTRSVINNNPWAYFRSTRYCPHCLAGDGSEIQQRHGGPWQRLWRLPVVFACLKHRCFLRHRCPACDQLVQFTARTRSLIPRPGDGSLHPAQCRSNAGSARSAQPPACGYSLDGPLPDRSGPLDDQSRDELLRVQRRLVTLLTAPDRDTTHSIGTPVSISHYFMDLRTLMVLIFASWPTGRTYAATLSLASALDTEAERRHKAYRDLQAKPGKRHHSRAYSAPPDDAVVTGAVLGIAETLLGIQNHDAATKRLFPLVFQSINRDPAASYYLRAMRRGTSSALQAALHVDRRKGSLRAHARAGGSRTT